MALQPKAEGDTRPPAWAWWLVVAFTLAAAFFRVFDLDRESLWNDELYSWYLANSDNVVGVLSQAMRDVHPPGYALILHGWMGLAGDGEAALRLPSVLAGTALIPLVFVCGRTLVGWRAALLAAGLGIGLNSHIATSQDARAYAMLSLVSLVYGTQVYGLTRGEGGRRRVLNVVLACIVAAGLVALHAFGALLVASLTLAGLWRVLRNRRVVWPVVLPALVGAAAFLIWIASLESDTQALGSWIERPGLRQWVTAPGFHFLRPSRWNGMFLLCPVLGWGVDRTLRSQSELSTGKANVGQDGALWCVAWVVIPLAIAWTVSWLWLPVLTERNFSLGQNH